ncbi:docking complex component 2, partial [Haematococcus lacustris]
MQALHVSAMLGPGAQVYELKEKATAEMAVLMGQAEKEQAGFEEEWRQLTQIIEDNKRERERARAQELAMRERETQELLKSGLAGSGRAGGSKHGISSLGRTTMLGPTYNKALAQNVAAEKVQMY